MCQDVEDLRFELDGRAAAAELEEQRVELEFAEDVDQVRLVWRGRLASGGLLGAAALALGGVTASFAGGSSSSTNSSNSSQ
jgi:hypothetical protein